MEDFIAQAGSFATEDWVHKAIAIAIIAVITGIAAHLVTKAIHLVFDRDDNPLPSSSIVLNIGRAAVWVIGGSIILDSCFGVKIDALITALGIGGIAISLGCQDTLANLIGGVQITFMKIIKPGDNIRVGSDTGVVQDIAWRHTTIKNRVSETVIIPNSVISKNALVQLPPSTSLTIWFAVTTSERSMDDVAARLKHLADEAAGRVANVTAEARVLFTEITEYGFKGKILLSIDDPALANAATDAVVRAIAPETR